MTTSPAHHWPSVAKRVCIGLIIIWLALLAISIPNQRLIGDEAWLGEQAYFLVHDGVMRSELFHGYALQHERILITHKLFIALGALMTVLFGWGLTPLRIVSLISGAVTVWLLVRELRRGSTDDTTLGWRIGLVALLGMPLYFTFINLYRPEVMLAACGLASYVALSGYLKQGTTITLITSAVLAGAAVLIHLNGVIFTGAALVVLLFHRQVARMGLYALIAVAVASLYFIDVIGHWNMLTYQLHQVPSLTPDDLHWSTPFWRVFDEHKRLFRKPEIIFTTLLFIASFLYAWRTRPDLRRSLLAYCVVIVIGLGAVAQAKTTPYAIALLPLFALVIAHATTHWIKNLNTTKRWLTALGIAVWGLFLAHSIVSNSLTALTGKHNVAREHRRMAQALPQGATVLAPMEFIFNEIDRFDVRAVMAAQLILAGHHEAGLTMEQINQYANAHDITAYIFNSKQRERFGLADAQLGDRYGSFVVALITDKGTVVLVYSPGSRYGLNTR